MPALVTDCKAYLDTFAGLIRCKVIEVHGQANNPTSSVKVEVELLENRGAYVKGERLQRSSLWVVPEKAVRRRKYSTTIGHYTVG